MLLGGVFCTVERAHEIHEEVCQLRRESNFPDDSLQWKNISSKKLRTYKALIDRIVELNGEKVLDYIVIVVNNKKLNHGRFNEGDGETFFQKMMCMLIEAKAKSYNYPDCIRAIHGQRDSRYSLEEVRGIINSRLAKESGEWRYTPLKQLDYMDVPKSGLHQIADLMLGCTAYFWNASMRKSPGSAKSEIAHYLQANCPLVSLGEPSPPWHSHFNVWEFRLR
jgi:hypothetical protein